MAASEWPGRVLTGWGIAIGELPDIVLLRDLGLSGLSGSACAMLCQKYFGAWTFRSRCSLVMAELGLTSLYSNDCSNARLLTIPKYYFNERMY
jgi:hypothetical protein